MHGKAKGQRPSANGRSPYILRYFGPLPPSRGVQRGPSTSVALQSMQFGAFTTSLSPDISYTPAGHMCTYISATSAGMSVPTIKCDGMSSRVAFPDLNTASTFDSTSGPDGIAGAGSEVSRASAASASTEIFPPGNAPPVSDISDAFAPPTKNPDLKASRMLRFLCR